MSPAIEQQGLLTNHPNANVNSAAHPFRKHGTDAGGVWVTTEPTAFPVYGTTIGGKNGNSAASDAAPKYVLDWDNIVYQPEKGYTPKIIEPADNSRFNTNIGHISAGTPRGHVKDVVTGEYLVNPNEQGAIDQFQQLGPDDIESLKNYNAYDDIVKDKDNPTWQELVRVIMRINAGTATPYW